MVVRFDIQPTHADRLQAAADRVTVNFTRYVRRVHDLREANERGVTTEVVLVDQDLEGALVAPVRVGGAWRVETDGALCLPLACSRAD